MKSFLFSIHGYEGRQCVNQSDDVIKVEQPLYQFKVHTGDGTFPLDDFIASRFVSVFDLLLFDMGLGVVVGWQGNVLSFQCMTNCRLVGHHTTDAIFHRVHVMNSALQSIIRRKRVLDGWHLIAKIVVQDRTVGPEPTPQHLHFVYDLPVFHGDSVSGLEVAVVSVIDCTIHGITFWHALFVEIHDLFRIFDEQLCTVAECWSKSMPVHGKFASLTHKRRFVLSFGCIADTLPFQLECFVVDDSINMHLKGYFCTPVHCYC